MLRTTSLLISLACCPLFAVDSVRGVGTGPNDNGDWWREGQTVPWSFGVLDEDGNGKVSTGELAKARLQYAAALKETKASLIAAVDLDHRGNMSRYQAAEGSTRWLSLRERAREMANAANDRNENGKVDADEAGLLEKRIGKVFVTYGAIRVDRNKDQEKDKEKNKKMNGTGVDAAIMAIRDGKGAIFTLCDLSTDGQLSVREAEMGFDILAAAAGL